MNSWDTISFGDCIESIQAGVSLGGEDRVPGDREVGIVTLGAVSNSRFQPDSCKAVTADKIDRLGNHIRAGTVLMSRSNTIDLVGSSVFVDRDFPGLYLPDLIWELKLRKDSPLRPEFLAELIATSTGRRLVQSAAMGTSGSMKKLSMARLRRLQLPLVPKQLQNRWYEAHQQFMGVEQHLGELVKHKRVFKRGLMQELLTGRRRFPEYVGRRAWRSSSLGSLAAGITRRNADRETELVLTCSGLHGLIDQRDYFTKTIAGDSLEDYFLVRRGEFAYNRSSMSGYPYGAIKRLDRYNAGLLSTLNICFAIHGDGWLSDFAVHYFESGLLNHSLGRITRIGSRAHGLLNVTKADFFALEVPVPDIDEQEQIAGVLTALDAEIASLQGMLSAHASLKRGLMQRLLSGDIEVPQRLGTNGRGPDHDSDARDTDS